MSSEPNMTMRWQDQNIIQKDGHLSVNGRPLPTVAPAFHHNPPNLPGKSMVGLTVTAAPGSATPPHTHGGATVVATMIKGQTLNQMVCPDHDPQSQGSGPKVYGVGESWYEPPGCHHVRSECVGSEEAVFVANFIIDTERIEMLGVLDALVVIDGDEAQMERIRDGEERWRGKAGA